MRRKTEMMKSSAARQPPIDRKGESFTPSEETGCAQRRAAGLLRMRSGEHADMIRTSETLD